MPLRQRPNFFLTNGIWHSDRLRRSQPTDSHGQKLKHTTRMVSRGEVSFRQVSPIDVWDTTANGTCIPKDLCSKRFCEFMWVSLVWRYTLSLANNIAKYHSICISYSTSTHPQPGKSNRKSPETCLSEPSLIIDHRNKREAAKI